MSHILSRLDQLQAKIQTQPESGAMAANASTAATTTRTAAAAQPCAIGPTDTSVHARPASLENVHQDALHRLSSKLDTVERQLQANRENEGLMTQIASLLQQVEPRLQSHASMGDRLARIESQLQSHVSRVNSLEALSAETAPEGPELDLKQQHLSVSGQAADLERKHPPVEYVWLLQPF